MPLSLDTCSSLPLLLTSAGNLQIAMVVQSVREIPTYFTGNVGTGDGKVCDVQLYALEIRAGYRNRMCVCVCVCIKSILFCELHVGKFSGQVIIVRVNESRCPLLFCLPTFRLLDFIKISRGGYVIVAAALWQCVSREG